MLHLVGFFFTSINGIYKFYFHFFSYVGMSHQYIRTVKPLWRNAILPSPFHSNFRSTLLILQSSESCDIAVYFTLQNILKFRCRNFSFPSQLNVWLIHNFILFPVLSSCDIFWKCSYVGCLVHIYCVNVFILLSRRTNNYCPKQHQLITSLNPETRKWRI
jgi:hypothetical protein